MLACEGQTDRQTDRARFAMANRALNIASSATCCTEKLSQVSREYKPSVNT